MADRVVFDVLEESRNGSRWGQQNQSLSSDATVLSSSLSTGPPPSLGACQTFVIAGREARTADRTEALRVMKYRFRITDFSISAAGELPACTNRGAHTNRTDSTAQPGILACRFCRAELVRLITITRRVLRQAERQKISSRYDAVKALNHNDYAQICICSTIVLASTKQPVSACHVTILALCRGA